MIAVYHGNVTAKVIPAHIERRLFSVILQHCTTLPVSPKITVGKRSVDVDILRNAYVYRLLVTADFEPDKPKSDPRLPTAPPGKGGYYESWMAVVEGFGVADRLEVRSFINLFVYRESTWEQVAAVDPKELT